MDSQLPWSATYAVRRASLPGDKILLPPSALEQLLAAGDLPQPLTFQLGAVYAGIREFSAAEGEVAVSPFLADTLNLSDGASVTVHAKQLPKGRYVRLRPLEAGYNPDDWKALLERHLRASYTTLTRNQVLVVPGKQSFQFLVDKFEPDGDGICVVDTDLEVDIEALNEAQARETVQRILHSSGGEIDIWKPVEGEVASGEYVDYQLPSWDRAQPLTIRLTGGAALLVSPYSTRQRARPRIDEHVYADVGGDAKLTLNPVDVQSAESIFISVYAPRVPVSFRLAVGVDDASHDGEQQCPNCHQWVPAQTLLLHESFCRRHKIACACGQVLEKQAWPEHWQCDRDTIHGTGTTARQIHDDIYHQRQTCSCAYAAANMLDLAHHRTTVCPEKLILCQFCHLEVPQEGDPADPSPEALISGLTAHELADGSRTTECDVCAKFVRLRDMATHLKHHQLENKNKPTPAVCVNRLCGRTGRTHELCSICFGPLYVSMFDPDGRALRRRVERRYIAQFIQGCGKAWCKNQYCKTGSGRGMSSREALPLARPLVESVGSAAWFCVDESSQQRRKLAELLAGEKVYELGWCVAALEAEGTLDGARRWLKNCAPEIQ